MFKAVILIATFFAVNAFAFDQSKEGSGDAFIRCFGYHHGSNLDFYTNADATKVFVEVSGDGEPDVDPATGQEGKWPMYEISKMEKAGSVLAPGDYDKTLREAIPAMNDKTGSIEYDFVFVEASGPKNSKMQLNLNNWFGDSYLVIDGFVEPLVCEILQH